MKRMLIMIGLMTVILTGCQKQDVVTETPTAEPSYVLADLALSLPASSASTRLSADVVQADGQTFRGIQKLSIIPFSKQGKVEVGDQPSYYESASSVNNNWKVVENVHHYQKVHLMKGVASFLTYGQATAVDGGKVANGSLIPKVAGQSQTEGIMPDRVAVSPANISFELEQIYKSEGIPAEATAIADYLTYIAQAEATITNPETEETTTVSWKDSEDGWLNLIYLSFTNQGSEESSVMAGSARNVKAMVNTLYTLLSNINYAAGSKEKAIVDEILSRIRAYPKPTETTTSWVTFSDGQVTSLGEKDLYPNNLDLPDGAAALLWNKTQQKFEPQTATTLTAPINTISRFAYPAELYYYGNSQINTSNTDVESTAYQGKPSWNDVLALYPNQNAVVSGNTKAVAIRDLLQYGVAHLSATVQSSSSLPDADNNSVEVGGTTFPIKGIIVCGQMPVDFEFKPRTTGDELFVYDSRLNTNTNNTPFYLRTSDPAAGPFHTLVLQSQDLKDVTVMLELQNNSNKNFKGENGIVYKGTHFYLLGQINLPASAASETEDYKKRVFTQDHTTTVSMKVNTLAHAYNVMPNILAGRLEIGVDIKLDWVEAKPTTVILSGEDEE